MPDYFFTHRQLEVIFAVVEYFCDNAEAEDYFLATQSYGIDSANREEIVEALKALEAYVVEDFQE